MDVHSWQIASTPYEREIGLMNYEILKQDEGMLFFFEEEKQQGFWMKNMSFPLDIIWINSNLEVVGFVKDAQPCAFDCKVFYPENEASYVLEINSGKIEELGIDLGDKVTLSRQ